MMMQMPMDMAPIRMASAMLWSSHDLFPEMVRRHFVDDDEREDENEDAESGVDESVQ